MKTWFKFWMIISIIWAVLLIAVMSYLCYSQDSFQKVKDSPYRNKHTLFVQVFPYQFEHEMSVFLYVVNFEHYYPLLYWKDKKTGKPLNPYLGCNYETCKISGNKDFEAFQNVKRQYQTGEVEPVVSIYYPILAAYIVIPSFTLFILMWILKCLFSKIRKKKVHY